MKARIWVVMGVVLALALSASAGTVIKNAVGYDDTVVIRDAILEDTLRYTTALTITNGEDLRILCKHQDTSNAGFGSDSIEFDWGYQIGVVTLDSAGAQDTAYDDRIRVSVMAGDSLGVANVGTTDSTGAVTRNIGGIDTTSVTGFAVQSRWIVPEWGEIIRYWVSGNADNNSDSTITVFEQHQRAHVATGRN